MAIGSAPEIGVSFTRWGEMTVEQKQSWFNWLRTAPPDGTIVDRKPRLRPDQEETHAQEEGPYTED